MKLYKGATSSAVITICLAILSEQVTCQFYSMENINDFSYDCFDSIRYNKNPKEVFMLSNPEDGDNG